VKPDAPVVRTNANTPELPSRTQFLSSKLKDPAITKLFSDAFEDQAAKSESAIKTLRTSLKQGSMSPTQYAESANTIIVSALQVTADRVLGKIEFRGKCAQKEHTTQRSQQENGNYKSSPYNENAAHKLSVHSAVRALLHELEHPILPIEVEHPILPIDPLFHEAITRQELAVEIKKQNFDKSPGDDGITNRMIQAAGPQFQELLYDMFGTLWTHDIQPAAWQMSLMQPIYKGGNKSRAYTASYRGINLSSALAKLFERNLISRQTKFTETHNTLTKKQLWTRAGRQIHDAIYCLLFIIQYNITQKGLATYVAFCDFSTAFSSIHRGKFLSLLCKENIVGRMWKHLRERFQVVKVRVLRPRISKNSSVAILQGVLVGSKLSPTLFGIFVANLIHELKEKFPNASITHNGGLRWVGGILYVDDLCLISTDVHELRMMINTCQT